MVIDNFQQNKQTKKVFVVNESVIKGKQVVSSLHKHLLVALVLHLILLLIRNN